MIVYIIHEKKIFSLTLPKSISGSYNVTDIKNNKTRMLLSIQEENGKWVARNNKHVKIWQDKKEVNEVILENYQYLLLQVKGEEGFLVMYTCPVNDSSFTGLTPLGNIDFFVGSEVSNDISCNNPLISPQHIKITYKDNNWFIEDLNTKYGTFIDKKILTGKTQLYHGSVIFILGFKLIPLGDTLYINNPMNSVKWNKKIFREALPKEGLTISINTEEDEEENIELYEENEYFIRSPRFMEVLEEKPFIIDNHPQTPEPDDTPLILTMGPMITMGMSSTVMLVSAINSYQTSDTKNIMNVLPTAIMSISMLAGTLLWPTLSRKYTEKKNAKKKKEIEEKYGTYLVKKEKELIEIAKLQGQILLSNNISPIECSQIILTKNKSLWMRELHQDDFLALRLGIGKVPLKIKFTYPEEHFRLDDDNLDEKMKQILEAHKYINGVPVVQSFIQKNIVAIVGQYPLVKHYIDLMMLQMVTFHSYYDLKIVLFTNESNEEYWTYLKQMPHVFRNDKQMRFFASNYDDGKEISQYLLGIFNAREEKFKNSSQSSEKNDQYKSFDTYYVIITDDYESIRDNTLTEKILKQKGNLGFSLIILNDTIANMPTECKSFIGIESNQKGGVFESELKSDTQKEFAIEGVDKLNLNQISVILNNIPIQNTDETFSLPKTFGFLEMYNVGSIEQLNSLERWKQNNPITSLAVPVGIGNGGNLFKLDLHEKEQGPHGLIAGMTGSGKSEFIITYILSLAINFDPKEVQFVLIDYKGGGLVGAFENSQTGIKLPHLAGTITNLDTAEINRALASIDSELKRRQTLFNEAREKLNEGTIDIYKYQKYYREGLIDTPLSHLFIISDEFAELKSQQPEFMDQLISTARIGRSLGVHLILATQKPSGVVNDQIWSNSRFKVCLKVQDASDSNEVIKRPDAAMLKDIGRFYLQVGYDEYFAMGQSAYSGLPYIAKEKVYHQTDNSINFINNIGKNIKSIDMPKSEVKKAHGEELSNIVNYLYNLAKKENITVRQLWLEKLSSIILIDNLKKKYNYIKQNFIINPVIGEYDNPKFQKQGIYTLDLTHKGNAVIYSMNEKNTIMNTIIYSMITSYHTKELNMYVMDFDSQTLKIYEDAPQIGDVIFINEAEKITNCFKYLKEEIDKRKKLFQDYNGSYEFYCKNSGQTIPSIVTILYGYENFKETFEDLDEEFIKMSRDSANYGVYFILTAISDRSLRLSARNNFPQIIPLKLKEEIEYNMLLGKKAPLISEVEGRGVVLVDEEAYEFQTAVVCNEEELIDRIKNVTVYLNNQIKEHAPRIRILPESVRWKDIEELPITIDKVPIGMEVETLNISYYYFTKNLINIINASDQELVSYFSKVLIKKLQSENNIITLVSDNKKYLEDIQTSDFNTINNMIFNNTRNKPMLVFVTGIEKLIESAPDNIKNDFSGYINKVADLHNCYFIIIEKLDSMRSYMVEKWYKDYASTSYSIYIGKGLNNSIIHNLTNSLRELSAPIPNNHGYNIKNGLAIQIRVVEGE